MSTNGLIRWRRGKDRYLHSEDERFEIVPQYRSTVKPSGYWLEDRRTLRKGHPVRHDCFSVREAKARAESILEDEREPPARAPTITEDML